MASGALIVAIGPEDVASMSYLKEKNTAVCINSADYETITQKLKDIFTADFPRKKYISNAFDTCLNEHNIDKNTETIKQILLEAVQSISKGN